MSKHIVSNIKLTPATSTITFEADGTPYKTEGDQEGFKDYMRVAQYRCNKEGFPFDQAACAVMQEYLEQFIEAGFIVPAQATGNHTGAIIEGTNEATQTYPTSHHAIEAALVCLEEQARETESNAVGYVVTHVYSSTLYVVGYLEAPEIYVVFEATRGAWVYDSIP